MSELFYPTIDVFTYDLKSALNSSPTEINQNTASFRAKLPDGIELNDNEQESEYLELTHPNMLPFENKGLSGYYYPVRLNDVYGLQIDCSIDNLTEAQPLESFPLIKDEIEPKLKPNNSTIGQTWLITGWLKDPENQDPETLAKYCYQTLFRNSNWLQELYGKGSILNSHFFELWSYQSYPNPNIIILLFPDQKTAKKAATFYTDWMGLFSYRHKIIWAYYQSRLIKETLKEHYKKVEQNAKLVRENQNRKVSLEDLQTLFNNIQDILNKYTIDLLNLAFQKQIIDINLFNYKTRLSMIQKKAGKDSNLESFEQFSQLAENKYLTQIAKDDENMKLGMELLKNNINALRSQIELEKSQRDRSFQNIVTIVGTGTAIATLFDFEGKKCKAIFHVTQQTNPPHFCDNFFIGDILTPILILVILGGIVWVLKKLQ